jgi:hypothetical protein
VALLIAIDSVEPGWLSRGGPAAVWEIGPRLRLGLDCQWGAGDEPVSVAADLPAEPDRQPSSVISGIFRQTAEESGRVD